MADFLKAHPFVTIDEYMWEKNPCLLKLMAVDNTHVHYLSEKEKKRKRGKVIDGTNLVSDLGVPIFGEQE